MIVVRLNGGLGNQLFQYAAGRGLAARHDTELVLDDYWYSHTPGRDTPRMYELSNYPVNARRTTPLEAFWCRLHGGRITRRLPFLPRRWKHFSERSFAYQSEFSKLPDGVYLDGYWQSYKYFENVADVIRTELMPLQQMGEEDRAVAACMHTGVPISIHVRRGDYVSNPAAAQHGLCGLDYYRAAVQYLSQRISEPHFFVFSDDPEWTKANLRLPGSARYVDHNAAAFAFQDMRLMSLCKHNIVANSSFSWWGAWLNPDKEKLVICPRQWFADKRDTLSLTPREWVRL